VIEINHLVKKYGSHVAVDDLVADGRAGVKIYGFLGPNGAGKINNDEHYYWLPCSDIW